MKHRIDPKVDCVFKALLGSEANRNLLIHFLNAILTGELAAPIAEVEILNPYNEKEFLDDKLSIVDVKARDEAGNVFQVEVQLSNYGHLAARMLYTWADMYSQQLQSGQDYRLLKPTYSIWLLAENLIADDDYAHNYKLRDDNGRMLIDHGGIWVLELAKFDAERIATEQQRWLMFFKKGDQLDEANL
ncbi:MAG: Rpn family recombination-promoting nuclease/putative transposase, partial [Blastocatellia bacterium]